MWLSMLCLMFGIVVLAAPLIYALFIQLIHVHSENKPKVFVESFIIISLYSLTVAIITQSLHIFSYPLVLVLHMLFSGVYIARLRTKYRKIGNKNIHASTEVKKQVKIFIKTNVYTIFTFVIVCGFLLSLHYYYAGTINTVGGPKEVTRSSYAYPFYSDEWVGVALTKYSIDSGNLPIVNPLDENKPFPNFLFASHSLLAYLFLLLGVAPLISYAPFAVLCGCITCLLVYFVLRSVKIPKESEPSAFSVAVAILCIPFITNSGNLPGLWTLLPFNVSFVFLLAAMFGFLNASRQIFWISTVLSVVLYPPMVIFVTAFILGSYIQDKSFFNTVSVDTIKRSRKTAFIFFTSTGLILLAVHFLLKNSSFTELIQRAFSLLIRERLDSGVVYYEPWKIIPLFILPFVLIGMWQVWKKKMFFILSPVIVGVVFWILNAFIAKVIVIEPSRVVTITSILLVAVSAFGISSFSDFFLRKNPDVFDGFTMHSVKILILVYFVIMSLAASRFGLWHRLVLVIDLSGVKQELIPSPPVTRFLTDDDMRVFAYIIKKRFLAPSWKGLVIGAATQNYPLDSKTSTISNTQVSYVDFIKMNCDVKEKIALRFKIEYVYAQAFSCEGFEEINMGSETLRLYRVSR